MESAVAEIIERDSLLGLQILEIIQPNIIDIRATHEPTPAPNQNLKCNPNYVQVQCTKPTPLHYKNHLLSGQVPIHHLHVQLTLAVHNRHF